MGMTVVASVKGAPGVTTTALALAASWPVEHKVMLVEADPFGGDLAARYEVNPPTSLTRLLVAARRGVSAVEIGEHVQRLQGELPVVYGLNGSQIAFEPSAWANLADALSRLDVSIVVDAGRLMPDLGPAKPLIAHAENTIVIIEPLLEQISHLFQAMESLKKCTSGRRMLVCPTFGDGGYDPQEIAKVLKATVTQPIPYDPDGAAALAGRSDMRGIEKKPIMRWAAKFAGELV